MFGVEPFGFGARQQRTPHGDGAKTLTFKSADDGADEVALTASGLMMLSVRSTVIVLTFSSLDG